ncbi:MAG TPA: C-type lectin domain-containing protein [Kofleriaceae bacterium]|nr:C-type lectin domain-containing protein [Kofleriaceae bacterium]
MRWWIPLVLLIGCGGDDSSSHVDAGHGDPDGRRVDAGPCTGGQVAMTDPMTGHCYLLFTAPKAWAVAKTSCDAMAGFHLVRISSASEQMVAKAVSGLDVSWIGGSDSATEGTFVWDDGTATSYTNWKSGEPDNGANEVGAVEEDCIALDGGFSGGWTDRPCAPTSGTSVPSTYPYICERD